MAETQRIKICYVLNSFELGGAETVALDLARGHDQKRYEVEVVAALEPHNDVEPEMRRRFREEGVTTRAIRQSNFRSPLALWRLFWYLWRGKFDVVLGHNRGSDYWAVKLGALAGISKRYWTRHLVYRDMNKKQIDRYSSMSAQADKIIAVSNTVRDACIEIENIPAERVETIVNGIDTDKYKPLDADVTSEVRRTVGVREHDLFLLFVGRFSNQKAPEAFIDLVWNLRSRGLPVRGFMCGYGPLEDALRNKVRDGEEGVEILGMRSDVPVLLGACDLFISTSRNEGLPLNVMECMTAGTPFAAPAIPQILELVDGRPALHDHLFEAPPQEGEVPPDMINQWGDVVSRVIENKSHLHDVGRVGREVILERFSLRRMVSRYEALFGSDSQRR